MELEIRTADELVDRALEARWAGRRTGRLAESLRQVLRLFLERGGPLTVEAVAALVPAPVLAELDAEDLVVLREERIELAYPFAAGPNAFAVVLPDGRERYACCAIDALGIPAMVGQPVTIRSRCHHCGAPIGFAAHPTGPGAGAAGVMVWVGVWGPARGKVCTSL